MEQPTQENAEKGCDKHHLIYCSQCRHDRDVRELLSENERLHAENESLRASQQAERAVPTDAQIDAGVMALHKSGSRGARDKVERIYSAMLAASPVQQAAPAAPAGDVERERNHFEAWYSDQMRAAGYNADEGIANLRKGNHYGKHRVMLNGKWEGWQARAAIATQQH